VYYVFSSKELKGDAAQSSAITSPSSFEFIRPKRLKAACEEKNQKTRTFPGSALRRLRDCADLWNLRSPSPSLPAALRAPAKCLPLGVISSTMTGLPQWESAWKTIKTSAIFRGFLLPFDLHRRTHRNIRIVAYFPVSTLDFRGIARHFHFRAYCFFISLRSGYAHQPLNTTDRILS